MKMLKKPISAGSFLEAVKAAFPCTMPVLAGYIFMGAAFGILLASKGYGVLWALAMGVFVYAGSGQFLAVGIMSAGFDPFHAFTLTLMVNARHFFYGISMLNKFGGYKGFTKFYMIFSLTDETFALHISAKPHESVSREKFHFAVSLLDHLYWIIGCVIGSVAGTELPLNPAGIDFVMTALFVVIFIQQWSVKQNRTPALIGLGAAVLCRIVFGADLLIISCMAVLLAVFFLFKKPIEVAVGGGEGLEDLKYDDV